MTKRVRVLGPSGAGKTHLAERLAGRLGVPHLELDAFHHRAGWRTAPVEQFRADVCAAVADAERTHGGWVVDGNYRNRLIGLLADADTCVWLDYPRWLVMVRVVRRTFGRLLVRRRLWHGNRERWRSLTRVAPEDNIVRWAWTRHAVYRRDYAAAADLDAGTRIWVRLRSPRQAQRWLATVERAPDR